MYRLTQTQQRNQRPQAPPSLPSETHSRPGPARKNRASALRARQEGLMMSNSSSSSSSGSRRRSAGLADSDAGASSLQIVDHHAMEDNDTVVHLNTSTNNNGEKDYVSEEDDLSDYTDEEEEEPLGIEEANDSLRSLRSMEEPLGGEVVKPGRRTSRGSTGLPDDKLLHASSSSHMSLTEAETTDHSSSDDVTTTTETMPAPVDHEEEPDLEAVLETLNEEAADAKSVFTSVSARAVVVPRSSLIPTKPALKKSSLFADNGRRPSRVKSADAATLKERMGHTLALTSDDDGERVVEVPPMKDVSSSSSKSQRRRSSKTKTVKKRSIQSVVRSKTIGPIGSAPSTTSAKSSSRRDSLSKKGESTKPSPTKRGSNGRASARKERSASHNRAVEEKDSPNKEITGNSSAKDRMSRMLIKRVGSKGSGRAQRSSVALPITSTASTPQPSSLRRNRTVDVKLVNDNAPSPTTPRSLRKNRTVDERATPKRSFSNGMGIRAAIRASSSNAPKRSHSRGTTTPKRSHSKGTPKRHASSRPKTHLNIFGSDMVSEDFILAELDQLEQDTNIVVLELEDCLVAQRDSLVIPQRLKEILQGGPESCNPSTIRPWEGIHFVDELLDGFAYRKFKKSRKHFVRGMDGVLAQQMIACTFTTKINVNIDNAEEEPGRLQHLIQLVEEFRKDTSVVRLKIRTSFTTPELVRALTTLLLCDAREWEEIRLELGGGVASDAKAIKCLQRAAQSKDIELNLVLA